MSDVFDFTQQWHKTLLNWFKEQYLKTFETTRTFERCHCSA